jgi:hypothetical protein
MKQKTAAGIRVALSSTDLRPARMAAKRDGFAVKALPVAAKRHINVLNNIHSVVWEVAQSAMFRVVL